MARKNYNKVFQQAAKQIKSILLAQVPVYQGTRKDIKKGLLKGSLGVKVNENGWSVRMMKYGMFLNSGSGPYFKPSTAKPWNPRPGKGKGGIKPRYWENISKDVEIKIMDQIATAILNQNVQEIDDALKD
jgi:hypothetical protein